MFIKMWLEVGNLEKFDKEDAIKEVINDWKTETDDLFVKSLESMTENQFVSFIEKTFKNNEWEWQTYSQMKDPDKNPYFWFMVQAAIDFLSDKLVSYWIEKKFDKNWNFDEVNWKTLDDWINDAWWIDNKYWPKTRKIVELVQNILHINVDWSAGPQFFAKICSVLKWESSVTDFKVQDNPNYNYSFDNSNNLNDGLSDNNVLFHWDTISLWDDITLRDSKKHWDYENWDYQTINIYYKWKYTKCRLRKVNRALVIDTHGKDYDENTYWKFELKSNSDGTYSLTCIKEPWSVVDQNEMFPGVDKLFSQYDNIAVKNSDWTCNFYALDGSTLRVYWSDFKFVNSFSITNSDRYSHLRDDLWVWGFSKAFDCKYTDIKDIHDKKSDDENTLASLWSLLMSWWSKNNRISIAKWCMMDNSGTGTWWADFISWCENMIWLWFDKDSLTIKTWLAFSRINEDWIKNVLYKPASI